MKKFVIALLAVSALLCASGTSEARIRHHHRVKVVRTVPTPPDAITAFFGRLLNPRPIAVVAQQMYAPRLSRRALWNVTPIGGGRTIRATWYGHEMLRRGHSGRTATGERFNPEGWTMASSFIPLNTRVNVCAQACHIFRVNDRGGRFDLAHGGAQRIGVRRTQQVRYQILG